MNEDEGSPSSCWEDLPKDIVSNILGRLNLTYRLRMSAVCKSWRAMVLGDDVNSGPEVPWLLLPKARDSYDLNFFSLSEGRILNIETPLSALGGWCCGSSRGWLAFINGPKDCPLFSLVNPISRARIELPSLKTIPNFSEFLAKLPSYHNVSCFVQRIEVEDMGPSGLVVAGIFGYFETLAMCQPNEKKWTTFQGKKDCFFEDLLFHQNSLYTIMTGKNGNKPVHHTFRLRDCDLKLKVLSPPYEDVEEAPEEAEYENNPQFVIAKKMVAKLYLTESIYGALLMVVKYNDVFTMTNVGVDHVESPLKYFRTSEFAVLEIDPETGNWDWAQRLEHQTLFVAMSGTFCMPAKSFNMERGNCIYFAADLEKIFDRHFPMVSRESGVYYLENGRIERSFPSVKLPMTSRMCWFLPILM